MRALIVFVVLAAAPAVSRAAPPESEADTLIAKGLELRRQEKQIDALELFQRAHVLAPSPRTLGQMGLVEASLQRWVDAETHISAALAAANDPWVRKNHAFLDQALTTAKGHVGELEITGPPGTEISVDGKPVGTLPAVSILRRREGEAVVTASNTGFKEFSKTASVVAGSRTSLAIVLDPVDSRPAIAMAPPVPMVTTTTPPPPVVDGPHGSWRAWTGGALIATGAGALAWGIVWLAVDGNDACGSLTGPPCRSVYDTRTPGWILAGAGAAAATGGVLLLATGRHESRSDVAVGLTPTSLFVQGRF